MKKTKVFSFAIAAIMSLTSLPVLSVSAEDAVVGDVDGDGVITGHDSAAVSRYIYKDAAILSEAQKAIADINSDGIVDQTDLEWIHESEVWAIGDVLKVGDMNNCNSSLVHGAYMALCIWSIESAGGTIETQEYMPVSHPELKNFVARRDEIDKETDPNLYEVATFTTESTKINQISYNQLDADGDGKISGMDAWNLLFMSSTLNAGGKADMYYPEGRYDYCEPSDPFNTFRQQ